MAARGQYEQPTVLAECLFVDPVADLAVLGTPNTQALYDEADACKALTDAAEALPIGNAQNGPVWLLSLDGRSIRAVGRAYRSALSFTNAAEPIVGGMSGSPIVNAKGVAVAVLCASGEDSGVQPILTGCLPPWLS
jgi:hypothetical protein